MDKLFLQLPIYMYFMLLVVLIIIFKERYFNSIVKNFLYQFRFIKYVILALVVIVIIIFFLDRPISSTFAMHSNAHLLKITQVGDIMGQGVFIYSLLATLIIIYALLKIEGRFLVACKAAVASSVAAGIFVLIVKGIFSRERPCVALDPTHIFAYHLAMIHHQFCKFEYVSFPSGHTITMAAAVAPFVFIYWRTIWGKVIILLPLFVAFSRVYGIFHWTSDVVTSLILGFMFGYAVVISKKVKERLNK
ncbi:MAG: phosphatase PAP2 family protein [Fusobacteria bacterium]|nr:phosphatase PAP2 family protein [Fusobacteriota bacterium]